MRRLIFSTIALAAFAAPAALDAQPTRGPRTDRAPAMAGQQAGPGGNLGEQLIRYREELGLTTAQVAQIRRIQTQLQEQNLPLTEQLREHMQHARQDRPQPSAEQRTQMEARRAEMQVRMGERRDSMQARRGEMRDSMQARMGAMRERAQQMTPEQRAAMRASMEGRRAEMQERMQEHAQARGEPGMRRGPLGAGANAMPEELRAVADQIRQNTETAMRQIHETLTAEQRAKLRELRPGAARR